MQTRKRYYFLLSILTMIIKIYVDLSFAVIENQITRESISVSDNGSIHYCYTSQLTAIEKIYSSLEEFKLDTDRSATIKWLAVGVCGMPMDTKKEAQSVLNFAPVA